jgi:hypothetical protein
MYQQESSLARESSAAHLKANTDHRCWALRLIRKVSWTDPDPDTNPDLIRSLCMYVIMLVTRYHDIHVIVLPAEFINHPTRRLDQTTNS